MSCEGIINIGAKGIARKEVASWEFDPNKNALSKLQQ